MPTIPSHHDVGDSGHTTDHNAITDVLTDHEARLAGVQTAQPNYMVKTGGNVINLTNPNGVSESVVIPAGTRDNAAFVKTVFFSGKRTFGLDTYGQLRVDAAFPSTVAAEVSGYDASQTADLQRWKQHSAGAVLARVSSNGTIFAPNITPGPWTNLTLASGVAWYTSSNQARPQYRVIDDRVELRGAIKKSDGSDFSGSPQQVGTLPAPAAPPYLLSTIVASELGAGTCLVRLTISTSGLITFDRITAVSGGYTPAWVSLDGVFFSKTA